MDFWEVGMVADSLITTTWYTMHILGVYGEGLAITLNNSFPIRIIPATSDVIGITSSS